jgi:hypothetical protein
MFAAILRASSRVRSFAAEGSFAEKRGPKSSTNRTTRAGLGKLVVPRKLPRFLGPL